MTKGIYALFFMVMAGILFRQPAAAAGALMCTWALDQWARSQDSWFFANHGVTNVLNSLGVIAAILLRAVKGKPAFKPITREYLLTAALYGMAVCSVLWSINPTATFDQLMGNYKTVVVFAFLMPLVVSDLEDLSSVLFTVLTVGTAISVLVLTMGEWSGRFLVFQTGAVLAEEGTERGNPLAIASMAAYVALIAMLMNFRGKARFWQVLRYVIVGVAFILSVKSGSRGQTISIIFCVLCFLPYSRRFKDLKSFLTLAISISLFSLVTLWLLSTLTGDDSSAGVSDRWSWDAFVGSYEEGRVKTCMVLLSAWAAEGPIAWFIGLGSSAAFDPKILGAYPHVVFAEVLGEEGFVGWVMLWMFPIFCAANLKKLWPIVKEHAEERGLIAALGGLILFEIMMSFKQGSLLGSTVCFGLMNMLGRVTATVRQTQSNYAQLDAGMYEMSPADWDGVGEPYGESYDEYPMPGGVAVAHQNG